MAPASDVHGALVTRLARLGAGFDRCEVVSRAGIVPPERADSYYEADPRGDLRGADGAAVHRRAGPDRRVLSPSTATTDRERKLPDYRTIPSLQDILVVSSTEPRIEHFRREHGGWKVHDLRGQGTLRLEAFDITIDWPSCTGVLPSRDDQAEARAEQGWQCSMSPIVDYH